MTKYRRSFHVPALCLLASSLGGIATGCAVAAESTPAEAVGEAAEAVVIRKAWTTVATPYIDHQDGAAVLLGNGKVLVTNGPEFNAEIYDPVTNTWAFQPFSPGSTHWDFKYNLTAWLLPSGNVVVSPGFSGAFNGLYDLYDTTNNLWTTQWGPPMFGSLWHAGVTLQDGRAVVTGGSTLVSSSFTFVRAFDEPTMTWSTIGNLVHRREQHTSTVLDDGRIFSAGGESYLTVSGGYEYERLASTEIFDPATGASELAGSMAAARSAHTATRLANGKVLIAGGMGSLTTLMSSELYDPISGTLSPVGSLTRPRAAHSATLLQDGRVLVTGGEGTKTTELYNRATGLWSAGSPMNVTTRVHTATLLADGRVLVVGSVNNVPTAEIYDPSPQCVTFQRGSFGATADTQISTGALTKNYGTSVVANSGTVGGTGRLALFSFDLSLIPAGSKVTSATLRLYASAHGGPPASIAIHSVMVPWAETTVTWSSFGGAFEADAVAAFASSDAVGWQSADITGLVQRWQSGATASNGLILTKSISDGGYTSYATGEATTASTRPALEVCFVAP